MKWPLREITVQFSCEKMVWNSPPLFFAHHGTENAYASLRFFWHCFLTFQVNHRNGTSWERSWPDWSCFDAIICPVRKKCMGHLFQLENWILQSNVCCVLKINYIIDNPLPKLGISPAGIFLPLWQLENHARQQLTETTILCVIPTVLYII